MIRSSLRHGGSPIARATTTSKRSISSFHFPSGSQVLLLGGRRVQHLRPLALHISLTYPTNTTTQQDQKRYYVFIPTHWKQIQEDVRQWWWRRRRRTEEEQKGAHRGANMFVRVQRSTSSDRMSSWSWPKRIPPHLKTRIRIRSSSSNPIAKRRQEEEEALQRARRRRSSSSTRPRFELIRVTLDEYYEPSWFSSSSKRPLTSRDRGGRFVNPWNSFSTNGVHTWGDVLQWRWQRWRHGRQHHETKKKKGEVKHNNATSPYHSQSILSRTENVGTGDGRIQFTWIGHSTCFVRMPLCNNNNSRRTAMTNDDTPYATILTDPMLSARASPSPYIGGVKRTVPPACSIDDLLSASSASEGIDLCLLSHDHYDHLDWKSCHSLRHVVRLWAVPLGLKAWLVQNCGIEPNRIVELQWWDEMDVALERLKDNDKDPSSFSLRLACTPAQHWSTRWPWDRNQRLWCSWVVMNDWNASRRKRSTSHGGEQRFYFAGDTGYPTNGFPLHKQIGEAYGPFDLAAIPIGAYEPRFFMADSHVHPSEAVQIHQDVQAKRSVGIHYGSFPLSDEPLDEPAQVLQDEVNRVNNAGNHRSRVRQNRSGIRSTSDSSGRRSPIHSNRERIRLSSSKAGVDFVTIRMGETLEAPSRSN